MFVSQWLTGVLTNETSQANDCLQRICKKVRDEVIGEVDETKHVKNESFVRNLSFVRKPFRRSPMWTTARVMLQLLLANTLDEYSAMLLYKLVALRFLCTFLEKTFVKQLDTDTAMQMIAKVARRLYKVDCVLQRNLSAPECLLLLARQSKIDVADALERTRALLDERWAAIIEKERVESQFTPPPPLEQFLADTKHEVTYINNHIECLETGSDPQPPQAENLPKPTENEILKNFLYETETLRLEALPRQSCANIRELFEKYLRESFKVYPPISEPLGVGVMFLTLLKLICALDEKATEKFPLLKEHKLGISPTLIQSLLLPLKSDMELAAELEEYLITRQYPTLPSLIGETHISEQSYSVRHSQRSQQMQQCKCSILELASKTETERKEAVNSSRERYNALSEEISKLLAQCSYSHSAACTECHKRSEQKISEREQIRVCVYTRRLPAEEYCRDAVVFELLAPIEIVSLRDCVYLFNSRVFGFVDTPSAFDLFHTRIFKSLERFRVLQFYKQSNVKDMLKFDLQEERIQNKELLIDFKDFLNISKRKTKFYTDYIGYDDDYNGFNNMHDDFEEVICSSQKFFRLDTNCKFISERFLVADRIDESISEYCTFLVETDQFEDDNLQWAINPTINTQNVALSKIDNYPCNTSPAEFREFGTLRAGHRLQLRNLYRALEQRTLALKSGAVLALILQSLWQAGPPLSSNETTLVNRKWIRDSHMDLLCPHFCSKLIDLCLSVVERYSRDWTAHTVLIAIETVLSRVVSLNPDVQIRCKAIRAQIRCLRIAYNWVNQLKNLLAKSHELSDEESERLIRHLIEACCCEIFCLFLDSGSLTLLFSILGSGKRAYVV